MLDDAYLEDLQLLCLDGSPGPPPLGAPWPVLSLEGFTRVVIAVSIHGACTGRESREPANY